MRKIAPRLLLIVLISSCTDHGRLERRENRIEGKWYFKRAYYKNDHAIFRENIFADYAGDEITFYDDGFAEYYDSSLDAYFSGDWFLTLHKTQCLDETERIYTLDMEFSDTINNENFSFYGDAARIGFHTLKFEVYDDRGYYTFKMKKH